MRLFVAKETNPEETRVPLLAGDVARLVALGAEVEVETGIGQSIDLEDAEYEKAKVRLEKVIKEMVPFLIALLLVLVICTYIPGIVMWLPNLLIK